MSRIGGTLQVRMWKAPLVGGAPFGLLGHAQPGRIEMVAKKVEAAFDPVDERLHCCGAYVGLWPLADSPLARSDVRS